MAVCLDTETRTHFDADQKQIRGITYAELSNVDHENIDNETIDAALQSKLSQAININYTLEHTVHAKKRDAADTTVGPQDSCWDS